MVTTLDREDIEHLHCCRKFCWTVLSPEKGRVLHIFGCVVSASRGSLYFLLLLHLFIYFPLLYFYLFTEYLEENQEKLYGKQNSKKVSKISTTDICIQYNSPLPCDCGWALPNQVRAFERGFRNKRKKSEIQSNRDILLLALTKQTAMF